MKSMNFGNKIGRILLALSFIAGIGLVSSTAVQAQRTGTATATIGATGTMIVIAIIVATINMVATEVTGTVVTGTAVMGTVVMVGMVATTRLR